MGKDYSEYEKLAMKSLMRIWQNNEVFLKAEVCGDVIAIYYYCDNESFDVEKEQFFLSKFLKVSKFDKKNWSVNPAISVHKFRFNYSDIIFKRQSNFVTLFLIEKLLYFFQPYVYIL